MEAFADWGRLHPALVHLPIGFVLALALLEMTALATRAELPRRAVGPLVFVTALVALAAAAAGWILHETGDYGEELVERHELFALIVTGLIWAAFACHAKSRRGEEAGWLAMYRMLLVAAAILVGPAGHLGGSLTHGSNYLEPLFGGWFGEEQPDRGGAPVAPPETADTSSAAADEKPADETTTAPADTERAGTGPDGPAGVGVGVGANKAEQSSTFTEHIAPFFATYCARCHGAEKKKGALALHTPDAIQHGALGDPVLVPGDAAGSVLVQRLRLPLEHDDHMPPDGKPQPSAEELQRIEAWIGAGAPFEGAVELGGADAPNPKQPSTEPEPESARAAPIEQAPKGPTPDPVAIAALRAAFVHVEALGVSSNDLWIDFSATATSIGDEQVSSLLEPLAANIVHLNLARTAVGPRTLGLVQRMPRLAQLQLTSTPVDDDALEAVAGHSALSTLILAETAVGDGSVETLASLSSLQRLHVWGSALTPDGSARLAALRPDLAIDDGRRPPPAVLEVEPEVRFVDAAATTLTATNAECPVSGQPADARFTILHAGELIAFCCADCPGSFWAGLAGD